MDFMKGFLQFVYFTSLDPIQVFIYMF